MAPGQYGLQMLMHEIGHAIGLQHPFADADDPTKPAMPAAYDNFRYSLMSYTYNQQSTIFPTTPMLYDIAAIQYIYGANMQTRAGDTVYTFSAAKEYFQCIWDAGGNDTFDLSNHGKPQIIDLADGAFSSIGRKTNGQPAISNVGIAFGAVIENAFGGQGNDKISGNDANNHLKGNSGNDTLDGRGGFDVLEGGMGSDTYIVDSTYDSVLETVIGIPNGGNDTVRSSASFTLNFNVENLVLTGTDHINATGNELKNALTGNDGFVSTSSEPCLTGSGSDLPWMGAAIGGRSNLKQRQLRRARWRIWGFQERAWT